MYQALYRKWRPQTFDEVVGQKHITDTLKNQVISGRLSHAYIFIGTRGTGKTTCARILAKAVNCENPVDGNPCGVCAACRGIADGSVLDIVELDAASNNGVDNVRALREEAVFSPAAVKKRVYIIDEVHMLSTPAFNALLKILEEPPQHLMFILATTELQKVPATILSRCQRHQFRRIDSGTIAEYLRFIAEKESFSLTDDAAELIARMADGGVRDALSLLDQCSASERIDVDAVYSSVGLAGNRRISKMLQNILRHDSAAALEEFDQLWMDGKDAAGFLSELCGLLRDILIVSVAGAGGTSLISGSYDMSSLRSFTNEMTSEEIICSIDTVRRCMDGMRDARSPRTAAELCLVSLCDNTLGEDISQLRARISRLEARLDSGAFAEKPNAGSLSAGNSHYHHDEQTPAYGEDEDEPEYDQDRLLAELPFENEDEQQEDTAPPDFAEEQPEDVIFDRSGDDAASSPADDTGAEAVRAERPEPAAQWGAICEQVAPKLPFELRFSLNDDCKVRGQICGSVLRIEAEQGFMFNRLNRSDVMKIFSDAATELMGVSINAAVSELKLAPEKAKDLSELKRFPETIIK